MQKSTLFPVIVSENGDLLLKALLVLAGLGSSFSETWENNLIFHLALLFLTAEALKCEPKCVWYHHHRIS